MPGSQDHIKQALHNLSFLEKVNKSLPDYYDWQVTVSFYCALHLVNAHLSHFNLQYRKHKDVKDVLNPFNQLSMARLPESEYAAYVALQSLSRRARYLVNEKDDNLTSEQPFFTYDKHFGKALKPLNTLMSYFNGRYRLSLPKVRVACVDLQYQNLIFIIKP